MLLLMHAPTLTRGCVIPRCFFSFRDADDVSFPSTPIFLSSSSSSFIVIEQEKLTTLLKTVLGTEAARAKAARGIFGGTLPGWFNVRPHPNPLILTCLLYTSDAADDM
eukprot:1684283-Rhodomonas_salina.1